MKVPDRAHKIELTILISETDSKKIHRNVDKDLQTIGLVMVTWGKIFRPLLLNLPNAATL